MTRRVEAIWLLGGVLVAGFLTAGCSKSLPIPTVVPVKLKVLFNDKPAVGAVVTLLAIDLSVRRPKGFVGPDGYVALTTLSPGDGAPTGHYRVAVEWPDGAERFTKQQMMDAAFGGESQADRFGGKFVNPNTTPYEITVDASKPELPPLVLTE